MGTGGFGIHPGVRMGASIVAALKEKTGRSLEQWVELIRSAGPPTEKERVAWLKAEHGLGTNYAGMLAEAADGRGRERWDPDAYLSAARGYVERSTPERKST